MGDNYSAKESRPDGMRGSSGTREMPHGDMIGNSNRRQEQHVVVAECRDGLLRQVSLEAIAAARGCMADGDKLAVLLLCGDGAEASAAAEQLARRAPNEVIVVDHPVLGRYAPDTHLAAVLAAAKALAPEARWWWLGHTAIGRDLARDWRLAWARASIRCAAAARGGDGRIELARALLAGKALERRAFCRATRLSSPCARITSPRRNLSTGQPRRSAAYRSTRLRRASSFASVVRRASGTVDLAEARIIVAGGRGVKSAAGFAPLAELAALLGGAVGASRGACDAGYCDYALQIGQTGKTVTPDLYIACGISGAVQHLAGISRSPGLSSRSTRTPKLGSSDVADYGIVGDLFEVVPALIAELSGGNKSFPGFFPYS